MNWVFVTIVAASAQAIRTSLQKQLKSSLSTSYVTWARFAFGLPFALIYFICLKYLGFTMPDINSSFLLNSFLASICQIIGTFLLIALFSYKNFAISIIYAKTEVIQTAIIGMIFFRENLTLFGIFAIMLAVIGIFIISCAEEKITFKSLVRALNCKAAIIGLLSGTFFSLAALFIKNASYYLGLETAIASSATTLLIMSLMQTIMLSLYLFIKAENQFNEICKNTKPMIFIGLTSIIGSIGWFTAFALTKVAYVKVVGQIELLFSIFITHKIFKEKFNQAELLGGLFICFSILMLIIAL